MASQWFECRTRVFEQHGVTWRHTRFGSGHEEIEADGCDAVLIERAGERSWTVTRWPVYMHKGDNCARLAERTFRAIGTAPPLAKAAKLVKAIR